MKVKLFGKPEFLNLYNKYFAPLLRGINISDWDLDMYFLPPAEMPQTNANSRRPHFAPPKTIRIPIPELQDVSPSLLFRSQISIIGHEIGHFIHTQFMGADNSSKWQDWSRLKGRQLNFNWQTTDLGSARHPYPHVPSYENFADDVAAWLQGERLEMETFYMGLWQQETKVNKQQLDIAKGIWNHTGESGRMALRKHMEEFNPRMLVYL